jgi:hypothetical protein
MIGGVGSVRGLTVKKKEKRKEKKNRKKRKQLVSFYRSLAPLVEYREGRQKVVAELADFS